MLLLVAVADAVDVDVLVAEPVAVPVAELEAVPDGVEVADAELLGAAEPVPLGVAAAELLPLAEPDALPLGEGLGLLEPLPEGEAVETAVTLADADALLVADEVDVAVDVAVKLLVDVVLGVGVPLGVLEELGVALGEGDALGQHSGIAITPRSSTGIGDWNKVYPSLPMSSSAVASEAAPSASVTVALTVNRPGRRGPFLMVTTLPDGFSGSKTGHAPPAAGASRLTTGWNSMNVWFATPHAYVMGVPSGSAAPDAFSTA